jgi:type II secretory pathway pseudopilin PulG
MRLFERLSGDRTRRGAITLPELIVLWLLCVVGLALTIPWLLTVRESSRRSQAQANMKNLGTALHAYHDLWRRFPGR